MDLSLLEIIALYAVPVIFAITLHEAAHGYVANMLGDRTAHMLGRVTLNPIRHIDPLGTLIVPLALLLLTKFAGGGLLFGWARPVPVNFNNLRHPRRDMFWVALAGPATNLAMALGWAVLQRLSSDGGPLASEGLEAMSDFGVVFNIVLLVLNLLPILPLDGGRIALSLLPSAAAARFSRLERYGFIVLIVLLATHVLERVMTPLVIGVHSLLQAIVGL